MVEVKRRDYPQRMGRNGKEIPASFECKYIAGGKVIAYYESKQDTLYLKTDYIGTDWSKSPYERALSCERKEEYKYLFNMLGADNTSKISEYTNI